MLDELQPTGLNLQIEQKDNAHYNFSDILDYRRQHFPAPAAPQPPTDTASVFPISIHQLVFAAAHIGVNAPYLNEPLVLDVNDASIALADFSTVTETQPEVLKTLALRSGKGAIALKKIAVKFLREQEPFATQLQNIEFDIAGLSTRSAQDESFSFALTDASGGQLAVKAFVALGAQHSSGSVTLRNLDLVPAWRYFSPNLSSTAQHGALDGDLQFTLNWAESLHYTLHHSQLVLRDMQLQSKTDADTHVALAALHINGLELDSKVPSVRIDRITLHEPVLYGWNRDTRVSLIDMTRTFFKEQQEAKAPWQIQIGAIDSDGGAIHWRANQLDNLPLLLAPLSAHVSNLYWPDTAPLQLQFATRINNDTTLALQGELIPTDVTGKLNVDISALPIAWVNPILAQHMRATLRSGALSTHTQLTLEKRALTSVQSDGTIDQFELQRQPDNRKLLAWKQMQWQQLAFDLRSNQLQLRRRRLRSTVGAISHQHRRHQQLPAIADRPNRGRSIDSATGAKAGAKN